RSSKVKYNDYWIHSIDYCSCNKPISTTEDSVARGTSVEKLIGPVHDTYPNREHCWVISNGTRKEYVLLKIKTPVFIRSVHIYEDVNPGAVVKLEIADKRNIWFVVWEGDEPPVHGITNRIFSPVLRRFRISSDRLRVTVDPTKYKAIAINAIKIIGSNIFEPLVRYIPLSDALSELFNNNNQYTNIQFDVDGHLIKAHKNILCSRSKYFRTLILNNMCENQSSKEEPLLIKDVNYDTFVEMLYFLYTGTLHRNLSYNRYIDCLIYSTRINLTAAKNASLERLCCHLKTNHDDIISTYLKVKHLSPLCDQLIEYIYDLCTYSTMKIFHKEAFWNLDKDSMMDLLKKHAERLDAMEKAELDTRMLIEAAALQGTIRISKGNREIDPREEEKEGIVQNITKQAYWHVSSCKPGHGVDKLLDENLETYWQSDGPQPHLVNIQFKKKTKIKDICLFSDFKLDESYTPNRISIRTGIHHNDLQELQLVDLHEPAGWVVIPTRDSHGNPIKTWMIQIAVLANHQSGRDTHIRQIIVHSPTETSSIFIDPKFSSIELSQHVICR
ncbi:unnamed protein product, partial [Didymodactylos carnosus]